MTVSGHGAAGDQPAVEKCVRPPDRQGGNLTGDTQLRDLDRLDRPGDAGTSAVDRPIEDEIRWNAADAGGGSRSIAARVVSAWPLLASVAGLVTALMIAAPTDRSQPAGDETLGARVKGWQASTPGAMKWPDDLPHLGYQGVDPPQPIAPPVARREAVQRPSEPTARTTGPAAAANPITTVTVVVPAPATFVPQLPEWGLRPLDSPPPLVPPPALTVEQAAAPVTILAPAASEPKTVQVPTAADDDPEPEARRASPPTLRRIRRPAAVVAPRRPSPSRPKEAPTWDEKVFQLPKS